MKFSLFSAVFFCVGLMSVMVTGDVRPATCCLTVKNTKVPVENIVKYDIQKPTTVCPLRAVRFHTKKDITICSDPESKWAKKAMETVDGRTTIKPSIKPTCFTRTTNMIPTTTNTTPETETSTSTTEPPKVTRSKTSGPETETSTTTTQQTSVTKETPESSSSIVKTCGTRGPTAPPTETTPGQDTDQTTTSTTKTETTSTETTTSPPKKTKLSPLLIKKRRKSKKQLHKYQYKSG